jgi:hypothetical protein
MSRQILLALVKITKIPQPANLLTDFKITMSARPLLVKRLYRLEMATRSSSSSKSKIKNLSSKQEIISFKQITKMVFSLRMGQVWIRLRMQRVIPFSFQLARLVEWCRLEIMRLRINRCLFYHNNLQGITLKFNWKVLPPSSKHNKFQNQYLIKFKIPIVDQNFFNRWECLKTKGMTKSKLLSLISTKKRPRKHPDKLPSVQPKFQN